MIRMAEPLQLFIDRIPTPIGQFVIIADEAGALRATDWSDHDDRMHRLMRSHYGGGGYVLSPKRNPSGLSDRLAAYYAGDLAVIDTLPVAGIGTTFQRKVWAALRDIPCGETISYGTLARRIGQPTAMRAVGLANGANPIGVVVPCHRVIGSDGSLTGYGGGIERKRWLLAHEKASGVVQELPLAG
jgi:methylated-DNA-[protein]-cysteine S-methyltransferase